MVAQYPPGATYGPRQLLDFEFVWMLSGSALWRSDAADGQHHSCLIRPGALLLAQPGMIDRFRWDAVRPSVHAFTHFRVDEPGPLGDPEAWPLVRQLSASDPMAALCRYLLWLGGTPSDRTRARKVEVLGWLLDLFVNGPFAEDEEPLPDHLDRLIDHLRVAWKRGRMRAVTVGEMADAAGVSAGHLARIFRRRFGIGPVAAVDLIRLARAATLLRHSNLSIGAISDACGYANPFHFSRRFRRAYGTAPRTYRTTTPAGDPLDPISSAGLLPLAHRLLFEDL